MRSAAIGVGGGSLIACEARAITTDGIGGCGNPDRPLAKVKRLAEYGALEACQGHPR